MRVSFIVMVSVSASVRFRISGRGQEIDRARYIVSVWDICILVLHLGLMLGLLLWLGLG